MIDAQAYVLRETGVIPELEDIQVSGELTAGQVRLKVLYSGLCATQMEEIFVSSRNTKYMPHLFGHEGVGVIEAVGPGVTTKQVGDTCVIHWRQSSVGLDANPGSYFVSGKKINSGKVVTFSTQVVVPENRTSHLPVGFTTNMGALLGCSLTTGWGSVAKVGQHKSSDRVLIVGLGAVGTSAAWTAFKRGSQTVLGVDSKPSVAARWSSSGVTHFFASISDLVDTSSTDANLSSIDLAIETSGNSEVIEFLVNNLPDRARLVLVGMPSSKRFPELNIQRLLDGLSLTGSNGGSVDPGQDLEPVASQFMSLLDSHLGGSVLTLEKDSLAAAISHFRDGSFLRIVLALG